MNSIKEVVYSVIKKISDQQPANSLWQAWEASTDKLTRQHAKPRVIKRGVLSVTVDNSSSMFELGLKKPQLISNLNKKGLAVKDIRFYIGEVEH